MKKGHEFTDEEIVAYLDGELEFTNADMIEGDLKTDSDLQTRIDALSIERNKISKAFDKLLDQAPPFPEMALPETSIVEASSQYTHASGFDWRRMAATMLVALGVGAFAGNFFADKRGTDWESYVAAYQALYGNVTLAHINQTDEEAISELARISSTIGKTLKLEQLQSFEELDYKRSQVLVYEDRPLVQITFLSKSGLPVALCIIRDKNGDTDKVRYREMEGMESAAWSRNGYNFFLIGTNDTELIERTANHFVDVFQS